MSVFVSLDCVSVPAYAQVSIPSSVLVTPDPTLTTNGITAATFQTNDSFNANVGIQAAITKAYGSDKACLGKYEVLLVHFARWTTNDDGSFRLHENLWNFYHATSAGGKCEYTLTALKANGQDPLLYRDKSGYFVGINIFDKPAAVQIAYKLSTTAETPENIKDAGALIEALLGAKGGGAPSTSQGYVAVGKMEGYKRLPFDFNISYSLSVPGAGLTADVTAHPGKDMQPGEVGTPYSAKIPYSDGTPPLSFAPDSAHPVPAGLKIETNGIVDGTPTTPTDNPASQSFEVKITDGSVPPKIVTSVFYLKVAAKGAPAQDGGGAAPDNKPAKQADSSSDSSGDTSGKSSSSKNKSNPTSVDCASVTAKSACSYNLSYESDDLEWWDVGMAVSAPGVKETQYSASSSNTVQSSVTTHTDFYALLDLFPGSYWKPKDSPIPHFVVGLPVTGKTFYRPVFGAGENITSWTGLEKRNFPLEISFVGGVVYMKDSVPRTLAVGSSATASQLKADLETRRVTKFWCGAELSVSALVSKIKKK